MLHVVIGVLMLLSGVLTAIIISGGLPLLLLHSGDVIIVLSCIVGGLLVAWGLGPKSFPSDEPARKH
jgi:hypothetical protein